MFGRRVESSKSPHSARRKRRTPLSPLCSHGMRGVVSGGNIGVFGIAGCRILFMPYTLHYRYRGPLGRVISWRVFPPRSRSWSFPPPSWSLKTCQSWLSGRLGKWTPFEKLCRAPPKAVHPILLHVGGSGVIASGVSALLIF